MKFCGNCGRELADTEICGCQNNQEATNNINAQAASFESQGYYNPTNDAQSVSYSDPFYGENTDYAAPNYNQNQSYQQPPQGQPYFVPPTPLSIPVEARTDYPEGYKPKKKYVAVILAASLVFIGIHNFYLGNNAKGLIQLLVCLFGSLICGIGFILTSVWALVECIGILIEKRDKDSEGFKIMTFEESLAKEMKK